MKRYLIRFIGFFIMVASGAIGRADAELTCNNYSPEIQAGGVIYKTAKCSETESGYITRSMCFVLGIQECRYGGGVGWVGVCNGMCDSTGMICDTDSGFIFNRCRLFDGTVDPSKPCDCTYSPFDYTTQSGPRDVFARCALGYYQTTYHGSGTVAPAGSTNGSFFATWCAPCSGITLDNNEFKTYTPNAGSNNQSVPPGMYWDKIKFTTAYNTACRVYADGQQTDKYGTFVLPTKTDVLNNVPGISSYYTEGGCPYMN